MTPGKSVIILLLFLLVFIPLAWFTNILPYRKASSILSGLPNLIDASIIQQYPSDLQINIKNGEVSLNQPTPYCLLLQSGKLTGILFVSSTEPNLSFFDSQGPYREYCQPIALVGKNFFMYPDKDQFKIQKISPQINFSIDQKTLSKLAVDYLPRIISFSQTAYLVFPFIVIIPIFIYFLLMNLWYAFFARFVVKLFKVRAFLSFSDIYATTLFFYTLLVFTKWFIISYCLNHLLNQKISLPIPFLNTIIITILSIIYYHNIKFSNTNPPEKPNTPSPSSPITFQTVKPPPSS